jgi:hypothetical protein
LVSTIVYDGGVSALTPNGNSNNQQQVNKYRIGHSLFGSEQLMGGGIVVLRFESAPI